MIIVYDYKLSFFKLVTVLIFSLKLLDSRFIFPKVIISINILNILFPFNRGFIYFLFVVNAQERYSAIS
jgi:hypothetical protein